MPVVSKPHLHAPDPFYDSPRETASSVDLYSDIPASCSAMSCGVSSPAGTCGHTKHTPFDTQRLFPHSSGPCAVGGYERYPSKPRSRSHIATHRALATSGLGAVSCPGSGGPGLGRQLSVRQSWGTSISGVTCGTCGVSMNSDCPDVHSSSNRRCRASKQHMRHDGMLLVWLGRAVLAGGVALMLLQGRLSKGQNKTNKGVRLRLGPVMKPNARDDSEMEEIILYPPEVLSRRMGRL